MYHKKNFLTDSAVQKNNRKIVEENANNRFTTGQKEEKNLGNVHSVLQFWCTCCVTFPVF
jgi:hypothetical protein